VWWDEAERWSWDPRVGGCAPFRVPLITSPLEIVGADAEGPLLLAVLPLPELDAVTAEGTCQRSVTFVHGQILTIDLTVDEGTTGKDGAYILQLTAVTTLLPGPPRATAPLLRIGLVEDDAFLRQALASLLRSAGLHVEAFASAEAFLDQAPQVRVDGLVCDVHLPGMSGLALQRTLIARQVSIPIMFLTGDDDPALARRARDAGAVAWLTKPVWESDLLHAIREWCRPHG